VALIEEFIKKQEWLLADNTVISTSRFKIFYLKIPAKIINHTQNIYEG
jgi:hypothetical protein